MNKVMHTILILATATFAIWLFHEKKDKPVYALYVTSVLGSPVHLATFDGNSSDRLEDCRLIAKLLTKEFGRDYSCMYLKDVQNILAINE